jgi:hypothetical protein
MLHDRTKKYIFEDIMHSNTPILLIINIVQFFEKTMQKDCEEKDDHANDDFMTNKLFEVCDNTLHIVRTKNMKIYTFTPHNLIFV